MFTVVFNTVKMLQLTVAGRLFHGNHSHVAIRRYWIQLTYRR